MLSIERFLPNMQQFSQMCLYVLIGEISLIFLFCVFALLTILGFIAGLDALAALSLALCVGMAFFFYLLRIYVRENALKNASLVKRDIEKSLEQEAIEPLEIADVFSRLSLSVRSFPPRFVRCSVPWLEIVINRIFGYFGWTSVHALGELLLLAAIDQCVEQIKVAPTNLRNHAALANCYIMLANHYQEPLKAKQLISWPGIFFSKAQQKSFAEKSRASSCCAIEELTILRSFAPDQLWVHDQLAISYRELEMPEKEIEECEVIIQLCPHDHQALLRLGVLYFREGRNARGLEMYERLKSEQPLLAEELIGHYAAYKPLILDL